MPLKPVTAMRKDKVTGKSVTTMQHRHFAFIATVLASNKPDASPVTPEYGQWRSTINAFAYNLEKTNPNFDRARFFSAVGVDDPYVTQAAYGEGPKLARDEITGKTFEETFGKLPDDWV